ncbi:MAG: YajQ family cyclic di-GMP-binding protein [Nitrospinae bacterium]|nr:YajQ family cyclic di-GMP-binding protein [Nitrospinota bacterium]
MAKEHTFDIVSKTDMAEVVNAVNQATAEIGQRYDFKGSKAELTVDQKASTVTILADDEMKLTAVIDILQSKLVKRGVSIKALDYGKKEAASGDMIRQVVTIQQGIATEKAKEVVKLIKQSKLKVQASIQEDQVRVSGKSLDDLQQVQKLVREQNYDFDLSFGNYR